MDEPTLARLAPTSRAGLSDHVYDAVVASLLNGDLAPGQPIRIETVAAQLGVSATPVREALQRIEATGLIRREAHKGFRVAPAPTPDDLIAIIEARTALEPFAARLACERADGALVDALERATARQREAIGREDRDGYRDFMLADQEFHEALMQGSRNRYLTQAADVVGGHVQRWRAFSGGVPVDRAEALEEHEIILAALRSRDPDATAEAMQTHLTNLLDRVWHQMEQQDEQR